MRRGAARRRASARPEDAQDRSLQGPSAVPVATFVRAVEAEVARSTLEGSGISCRVEPSEAAESDIRELLVDPSDMETATAILFPERRHQKLSPSIVCPACDARHGLRQGVAFWMLLLVVVAILFVVAFFVSRLQLLGLALTAASGLAALDLFLKDWKCARCAHRWRMPRG